MRAQLRRIPPDVRPWAIALASALCALVAITALWLSRTGARTSGPRPADLDPLVALPYAGTTSASAPTTGQGELVVHAAGALIRPGLYRLPAGSRVGDLVDAAGGPTPDADHDRVNLAAPLVDGARVYVPRLGETTVPAVDVGGGPDTAGPAGPTGPAVVDLNRATAEQLEDLPGVGPSIAAAIVDHRDANGPFETVDELLDVRGIGAARLEQLRPLVRV